MQDSQDVFSWRNDAATIQASLSAKPVMWEAHEKWYSKSLNTPLRLLLIVESSTQVKSKIGMVRFDLLTMPTVSQHLDTQAAQPLTYAEVSINLNPQLRGKGYGALCLESAISFFTATLKNSSFESCTHILAQIKATNDASKKVFEKAGFAKVYALRCEPGSILQYSYRLRETL